MDIIINVVEEPVKVKHISYSVSENFETLTLYEIEEVFYMHPDSQGHALISRLETKIIGNYNKMRDKDKISPYLMLGHALNTVHIIQTGKHRDNN